MSGDPSPSMSPTTGIELPRVTTVGAEAGSMLKMTGNPGSSPVRPKT
jgi:hypothetical protein